MMKTGDNNNNRKAMKMNRIKKKENILSPHITDHIFTRDWLHVHITDIFIMFMNTIPEPTQSAESLNIENFRCLVSNAIIALLSSYFHVISYNLSKTKRNTFLVHCRLHRWFVIWLVGWMDLIGQHRKDQKYHLFINDKSFASKRWKSQNRHNVKRKLFTCMYKCTVYSIHGTTVRIN